MDIKRTNKMNSKIIKEIAKKENKKIGKETINKILIHLKKETEEIIKRGAKNSDFLARKVIKPEDIEE